MISLLYLLTVTQRKKIVNRVGSYLYKQRSYQQYGNCNL